MIVDRDYAMLIGGNLETGTANFDVLNPASEKVIASAPEATQADLNRAIAAARTAFPGWAETPISKRKAALNAMTQALFDKVNDFKHLLRDEYWMGVTTASPALLAQD